MGARGRQRKTTTKARSSRGVMSSWLGAGTLPTPPIQASRRASKVGAAGLPGSTTADTRVLVGTWDRPSRALPAGHAGGGKAKPVHNREGRCYSHRARLRAALDKVLARANPCQRCLAAHRSQLSRRRRNQANASGHNTIRHTPFQASNHQGLHHAPVQASTMSDTPNVSKVVPATRQRRRPPPSRRHPAMQKPTPIASHKAAST